jgi:hypothetical protein
VTVDGYNRLGQPRGCCGIYRLAAPVAALQAGKPLQLKVVLEPLRSDALEISLGANLQQIEHMPDGRVLAVYSFSIFGRFIGGSFFRWERPSA